MIESSTTYYECEYCGKLSTSYEEIKECEKNCKSISKELEKIINSCNKLKDLGCEIEIREYPYYEKNKLTLAAIRRIKKEYSLVPKETTLTVTSDFMGFSNSYGNSYGGCILTEGNTLNDRE